MRRFEEVYLKINNQLHEAMERKLEDYEKSDIIIDKFSIKYLKIKAAQYERLNIDEKLNYASKLDKELAALKRQIGGRSAEEYLYELRQRDYISEVEKYVIDLYLNEEE